MYMQVKKEIKNVYTSWYYNIQKLEVSTAVWLHIYCLTLWATSQGGLQSGSALHIR